MSRQCTICQEVENDSNSMYQLECGHVFHTSCIQRWFRSGHNSCPNCRSDTFNRIDEADVISRAMFLRRISTRKNAPKELKAIVKKVKTVEAKRRIIHKEMRQFRKKHKKILRKLKQLKEKYYYTQNRSEDLNYIIGCMSFPSIHVPQFVFRKN